MPAGKVGRQGEGGNCLRCDYKGWREKNIMCVWSAKVGARGSGREKVEGDQPRKRQNRMKERGFLPHLLLILALSDTPGEDDLTLPATL